MENRKITRINSNFKGIAKVGVCPICHGLCNNRVFTSTQQYGFKAHENCLLTMLDNCEGEKVAQGKPCKYEPFKCEIILKKNVKIASVILNDFSYFTCKAVNGSHFKASAYFNNARSLVRFLENAHNENIYSSAKITYQDNVYKLQTKNLDSFMDCLDIIRKLPTMKDGLPKQKNLKIIASNSVE